MIMGLVGFRTEPASEVFSPRSWVQGSPGLASLAELLSLGPRISRAPNFRNLLGQASTRDFYQLYIPKPLVSMLISDLG